MTRVLGGDGFRPTRGLGDQGPAGGKLQRRFRQDPLCQLMRRIQVLGLDDKLDFNLRLDMKGPGIVLMPMYKLFEYAGEGSLKKPDWHPKRF